VQTAAEELGLEVWTPDSVNAPEAHQKLRALAADLLVVCDYGEILTPATLAAATHGGINLHGSLLPKYRGAAPVQWAVLQGETETGNSVIQMTPGLDAGPCLAQQTTRIGPEETAVEVESRLAEMGAELVLEVLEQLASGTSKPIRQDLALATKAPRFKKEHGQIDWTRSAAQIKNQVRALVPWPRAFTYWQRSPADGGPMRLCIDRVAIVMCNASRDAEPGTVLAADNRLEVQSGDGALEIVRLQPAGKRSMAGEEFLRGNRVRAGDQFGRG
jgi:methionyl-tRNA formyltransferase